MSRQLKFAAALSTALAATPAVAQQQPETFLFDDGHSHIRVCDQSSKVMLQVAYRIGISRDDLVRMGKDAFIKKYETINLREIAIRLHNAWVDAAGKHNLSLDNPNADATASYDAMKTEVEAAIAPHIQNIETLTGITLKAESVVENIAAMSTTPICRIGKAKTPGLDL